VQRFAVLDALTELNGFAAELLVGQRLNRGLERVDLGDQRAQAFQFAFILGSDDLGEERIEHLQLGMNQMKVSTNCSMRVRSSAGERRPRRARRYPIARGVITGSMLLGRATCYRAAVWVRSCSGLINLPFARIS